MFLIKLKPCGKSLITINQKNVNFWVHDFKCALFLLNLEMKFKKGQDQELFLNFLLLLLCVGIFIAYNFNISTKILNFTIIISFAAAIILLKKESNFTFIPFCILFLLLGMLRFNVVCILPANDISKFAGNDIKISGTIREQPRITVNADEINRVQYVVEVEEINLAKKNIKVTGGINLYARYKEKNLIPEARIGDKISAYGHLRLPINYNNPGQLDVVTMLKSDGITAIFTASKKGVEIEYAEVGIYTKFLRLMAEVREHYKESMKAVMSERDASAIFAMLFGGYEGLNPELVESFVTTGIVHILSVSGSHMSLLAVTVAFICNFFKLGRKLKLFLGFIVIFLYTVLSGFLFPVIRSAFMGFLVFYAASFDYEKDSRRSLTLIAMIMLLNSPLILFHISFQLTFTATAGLIYFSPIIGEKILKFMHDKLNFSKEIPTIKNRFLFNTAMSFACTISAVIFSQPIIAWYFNNLSLSSLISNLIVIPIIELIIIWGLFAGILGLIIAPLAKFVFLFDSLMLGLAYELNKIIANLPFSNIYFPTINFAWSIFYYIILIFMVQKKNKRDKFLEFCRENLKTIKISAAFAIISAIIFIGYKFTRPAEMEVHFIDVHQGDCALVVTPQGHAMMFDTGGIREHVFDIGARVDVPYLYHHGITELDYIFLSHAHEDHAAGAGSIIKKLPVEHIITAGESKETYAESMAISEYAPEMKKLRQATEGEIFNVDGVKVEVIYAPKVVNGVVTGNEVSNVYKVTFGKASFLFTGDLVKENEKIILHQNKNVQSTVLKVGHHGSKTSSSEEFLKAVNPKYAVFCVGANNTFGHPRPEVVKLCEDVGAKIYRTDKNGAIVFSTDGNRITVSPRIKN